MTIPINILASYTIDAVNNAPTINVAVSFTVADKVLVNNCGITIFTQAGEIGPADHPNFIFSDGPDMVNYFYSAAATGLIAQMNAAQSQYVYSIGSIATITQQEMDYIAGVATDLVPKTTTVNGHALSGNVTIAYSELSGLPGARSFNNPTITLNSAAQLSTTRDAFVSYPIDISVSSLLFGSASGSVFLEYADNSGMTTNLVSLPQGINATSGVLNISNIGTVSVSGIIPAGKYRRVRTNTNSGTVTFTSRPGQEVLL